MLDIVWQRLDHGIRASLPLVITLVCAVLGAVRWPLPHLGAVAPPTALIAVYYWSRYRPDLFGPGAAFIVGLLNDVINYLPPGLSAFVFVMAREMALHQRLFLAGQSFPVLWTGFTLTSLVAILIQWLLLCLLRWQAVPFIPVALQFVMAVAIFPLPCWIFARLQRVAYNQV